MEGKEYRWSSFSPAILHVNGCYIRLSVHFFFWFKTKFAQANPPSAFLFKVSHLSKAGTKKQTARGLFDFKGRPRANLKLLFHFFKKQVKSASSWHKKKLLKDSEASKLSRVIESQQRIRKEDHRRKREREQSLSSCCWIKEATHTSRPGPPASQADTNSCRKLSSRKFKELAASRHQSSFSCHAAESQRYYSIIIGLKNATCLW